MELFDPFFQAVDANGLPLSGGKLYLYRAGTSSLVTVYQDAAGTTPLTNPVTASASGIFPPIYLSTAFALKTVLKDAAGVTVQTLPTFNPVSVGVDAGMYVAASKTALDAITPETEYDGGMVLADATASNNGYYYRAAAAWVKGRGFPDTFRQVTLGGTANAQTGSVAAGVNPSDVLVYFATVSTANTGPMTLSVGGETARDVVNAAGNALSAGEWTGTVLFFLNSNGDYQLLIEAGAAASAAQSASDAEADRIASEQALADFTERYLGAYADDAAATVAAGGSPITGAEYWNTTSGKRKTWDGSVWVENSVALNDGDVTEPKLSAPLLALAQTKRTPKMFGAAGDDTGDDTAAILAALSDGPVIGDPGAVYRMTTELALPDDVFFDLNGATLKPVGSFNYPLNKQPPTFTTTTVASGFSVGSSSLDFTSVTGFAIGDEVFFDFNGGVFYAIITNIVGSTVTLDREVLIVPYTGAVNATKVDFHGDLLIANGIIDCSGIDTNSGGVGYTDHYRNQSWLDLKFEGLTLTGTGGGYGLVPYRGRSLRVDNCRWVDNVMEAQVVSAFLFDDALIRGNHVDGDGFGFSLDKCVHGRITENNLRGRYYSTGTGYSVRGIKIQYSRDCIIANNVVSDYDSALRFDEVGGSVIADNTVRRSGQSINISNTAANGQATGNVVSGNTLLDNQNVNAAIAVIDPVATAVKVTGNIIRDCQGDGIRADTTYIDVSNNAVINYGIANPTAHWPIVLGNASQLGIFDGNFAHSESPSTALGYYLAASTTGMQIGMNYGNLAANKLYNALPAPSKNTDMFLPGGRIQKTFEASLTTAYADYTFATAFPHGFLSFVSGVWLSGGAPANDGVVTYYEAGSNASKVSLKASEAGTYRITVLGY